MKTEHLVYYTNKDLGVVQFFQSLILSSYCFLPLECKLTENRDLVCLVLYHIPSSQSRVKTLDKYLLNENE